MNYDGYRDSLSRTVTWRVLLHLDYCTLTFGQGPCTATGTPCYYTYPTCKDAANYCKGTKTYAFCLAHGEPLPDSLPYLLDIKHVPTEIKPKNNVTRRARVTLEFLDDSPLALANPEKSISNIESEGSYFRNLIARNENAIGRVAEVWQGFSGLSLSEYQLVFRGVIQDIEWEQGRARVVVKDQLKLLDKRIPDRQSSDNVLTEPYNGESSMQVTDGSEFSAPGAVRVDEEYVTFTGVSADALTGCSSGAYGSTATLHETGARVKQVVVFAEEDGEGLPPDEIFFELLCTHGGIDPLYVAAVDTGSVLTQQVDAKVSEIPVDDAGPFPETGVIRLDEELIIYRGVLGPQLLVKTRGAYGTQAASHDEGSPVLISRLSNELGRWMSGTRYKRFVEQATQVKNLVNELREQSLTYLWQCEDSKIAAKCMAPPWYSQTPPELNDETSFIKGSTSWDPGLDLHASRVSVHYAPKEPDAGKDPDSYAGLLVTVDAESESSLYFGEVEQKEIWSNWIFREHEAILLASRYLIRYSHGAATFKFCLELKDSHIKVGDFVFISSRDVTGPSGAVREHALFEVIRKQRLTDNRIELVAMDTRLKKRYPVISSETVDYDDAGENLHNRYGWIGDADNKVGQDHEDGYYIY